MGTDAYLKIRAGADTHVLSADERASDDADDLVIHAEQLDSIVVMPPFDEEGQGDPDPPPSGSRPWWDYFEMHVEDDDEVFMFFGLRGWPEPTVLELTIHRQDDGTIEVSPPEFVKTAEFGDQ
jgi:hypothetical protein